ncbi:DNA gyrase subunit A [Sesbania bispinosa]|nr:DNA gyrase subunit A [Sesbania bispinosa]
MAMVTVVKKETKEVTFRAINEGGAFDGNRHVICGVVKSKIYPKDLVAFFMACHSHHFLTFFTQSQS